MSENSENMIERVALAIERTMFIAEELPCDPELHEKYKGTARAAIEAMREPTREMLNSGDEMMPQFSEADKNLTGFDISEEVWQAMIGTALGEDYS